MFFRKKTPPTTDIGYDPETQYPAIRSSICTGEKVAGFKNKKDGRFTEVMLIRSPEDEERFKKQYNVSELPVEY
ncbi:MAG: aspartate dehydrogenase [Clostridiales bacterium]|nr:aspartate dehydrogenase [Clostridiales bacterium]